MSNKTKLYHAIATSNGMGRVEINGVSAPVFLDEITLDTHPYGEHGLNFRCEVLYEDPQVTAALAFQNAVNQYEDTIKSALSGSLRTGYTYTNKNYADLNIKKVIFNDPATIVIWKDGEKTVVKACNEPFDPEKGLAMAIVKKAFGNKGNYFNELKKWLPEESVNVDDIS